MSEREYVSISGGADSTALALYMHDQGHQFELVFADTGAELPETYWCVSAVAQHIKHSLVVVSGGTFFQRLAVRKYYLPAARRRWCTAELKIRPLEYLEGLHHIGICAGEEHRMPEVSRPLVKAGISRQDARKMAKKKGLLNPIYQWRSHTSCFCCPFQRIADWRGLLIQHPDLYRLAEQWETIARAVGREMEVPPVTWIDNHTLTGLREAEEHQLKFWPEPEEPCAICTV